MPVQSVRSVSSCLVLIVLLTASAASDSTVDGAARECQTGLELLERRTYSDVRSAIEHFHRAIALDPEQARAWAGLADAHALLYEYELAEQAARRALEIDDSLAAAHASLGFVRMHAHWDWAAAGDHFERSLDLDPKNAQAHHWYAIWLEVMGRHDEAVGGAREALRLEPESTLFSLNLGYRLYWARRYEEAIRQLEAILEIDPSIANAHYFKGRCLVELGRYDRARAELERAGEIDPQNRNVTGAMAYLYARQGKPKRARSLLSDLDSRGTGGQPFASHIASIHLALGDSDTALRWLRRAFDLRGVALAWLAVDPRFDPLRSDERFITLLAEIGLEASASPEESR